MLLIILHIVVFYITLMIMKTQDTDMDVWLCSEDDTIGDLKKLVAAQTGTRPEKIRIQKWYNVYKDHITLADYEIHDGMGLELYYN